MLASPLNEFGGFVASFAGVGVGGGFAPMVFSEISNADNGEFPVGNGYFTANPIFNVDNAFKVVCGRCFCDLPRTSCPRRAVAGTCVNGYRIPVVGGGYRCIQFDVVAGSGKRLPAAVEATRVSALNFTLSAGVGANVASTYTTAFVNGGYITNSAGDELHGLALEMRQPEMYLFIACGIHVLQNKERSARGPPGETTPIGRGVFVPFEVSVSNSSVIEGNSGTTNMVFNVTLTPAHPHTVTVKYAATNGTATAGSDFVPQAGTLTFDAGQTRKTVTIVVNGDALYEPDEVFALVLSSPLGTRIGVGSAIGVIRNDENTPTLSITDVSLPEGNSGTTSFAFLVTKSFPTGSATTVNFTVTPGSATAGTDFVAQSGVLTLAAGETSKALTVAVKGDISIEFNETFSVVLGSSFGATVLKGTGAGIILNDDFPTLSISTPAPVLEGNNGATNKIMFVVTLSAAPTAPVSVSFNTGAGTATSASGDYIGKTGTLTFPTGTATLTQPILITITGDLVRESDETFTVTLTNPKQATLVAGKSVATGTILNDD